jgi:hypothetical protein
VAWSGRVAHARQRAPRTSSVKMTTDRLAGSAAIRGDGAQDAIAGTSSEDGTAMSTPSRVPFRRRGGLGWTTTICSLISAGLSDTQRRESSTVAVAWSIFFFGWPCVASNCRCTGRRLGFEGEFVSSETGTDFSTALRRSRVSRCGSWKISMTFELSTQRESNGSYRLDHAETFRFAWTTFELECFHF